MGLTRGSLGSDDLVDKFGTTAEGEPFRNPWPNTPDFTFNYRHLLELGNGEPLGSVAGETAAKRILIIGAGVSGLLTARELFRCGFKNIDIIEATDRLGGRIYSKMPFGKLPGEDGRYTPYEMGAMRLPMFNGNSVLSYYFDEFGIQTSAFPNPGTVDTGIWINQGRGVKDRFAVDQPDMYIWRGGAGANPPPDDFHSVYKKWQDFANLFVNDIKTRYADAATWPAYWQQVVDHYRERSFLEATLLDAVAPGELKGDGYYGGLGMTAQEARLFSTIGAGDGSWGAFFAISALYPIRTLLFGFGDDHQLALGTYSDDGEFSRGRHFGETLTDSLAQQFDGPLYVGVQSLAESLFYEEIPTTGHAAGSLYENLNRDPDRPGGIRLLLNTKVTEIAAGDTKTVTYATRSAVEPTTQHYEIVITTPTTWATQTTYRSFFTGLPTEVWDAFHASHWITSCKVFFPLKKTFWTDSQIPQIIVSDTQLQDSYGYVNPLAKNDPGVFLASYTWEDDALKFMADKGREYSLSFRLRKFLSEITTSARSVRTDIEKYLIIDDDAEEAVIHWTSEPSYRGCAKLYRPGSEFENHALLLFNQKYGRQYGIYVNGEASSVYGGWAEPALRHGLDTVINILNDTGGKFKKGFVHPRDYPQYADPNPYADKGVLNYCK